LGRRFWAFLLILTCGSEGADIGGGPHKGGERRRKIRRGEAAPRGSKRQVIRYIIQRLSFNPPLRRKKGS